MWTKIVPWRSGACQWGKGLIGSFFLLEPDTCEHAPAHIFQSFYQTPKMIISTGSKKLPKQPEILKKLDPAVVPQWKRLG
jgi:hypothetical protein